MDPLRYYFQGLAVHMSSSSSPRLSHTMTSTRFAFFGGDPNPIEEWTLDIMQGIPSDPILTRSVSLSDVEKEVLSSLLRTSSPNNNNNHTTANSMSSDAQQHTDILAKDIHVERVSDDNHEAVNTGDPINTIQPLTKHDSNEMRMDAQVEVGELCNLLTIQHIQKHSNFQNENLDLLSQSSIIDPSNLIHYQTLQHSYHKSNSSSCSSIDSDQEVRVEKMHNPTTTTTTGHDTKISIINNKNENTEEIELDDESSASSWNMEQGGYRHYDAWTVLQDEYASDFGFGGISNVINPNCTSMEPSILHHTWKTTHDPSSEVLSKTTSYHQQQQQQVEEEDDTNDDNIPFLILGTSIEDRDASPHVLSPPLMVSLTQFIPEVLMGQNLWLKYSLLRDGASMDTLVHYSRAGQYTLLAIETTEGHVLGSFTSSAWKYHPQGYYGSGEAFVWAMRYSRHTPCYSLYDQAQLESDVDIFPYSGLNSYIQLCTPDRIALGGGMLPTTPCTTTADTAEDPSLYYYEDPRAAFHVEQNSLDNDMDETGMGGFAIMIQKDLTQGISCPSATFRNPCLIHHASTAGETFQIVNIEVWTFTPCTTVEDAEKLEMRKFFIESMHSSDTQSSSHSSHGTYDNHHHYGYYHQNPSQSPKVDTKPMMRHTSHHSGSDYSKKGFYRRVGEDNQQIAHGEGEDQEQGWD